MSKPKSKRELSISAIKSLYGLDEKLVYQVIVELGYDALSDAAISLLEEKQEQYEYRQVAKTREHSLFNW